MPQYNIIYTSPHNDHYLWSGTSLDKLEKAGEENLMFSGKTFKKDELADAINNCKNEVKQLFPGDNDPKIKTVLIGVSD